MTMLDRMRRHKAWLKWSLGIVVVAFVLLYVPSFLAPPQTGAAAPGDVVATVAGRTITAQTFEQAYTNQVEQVRASYAGVTDAMLRQLQLGPRVLQQLVNEEAMVAEAERLGLRVTDSELREQLLRIPAFQQGGQFVGMQRYRDILAQARPPMTTAQFESSLRRSLLTQKLQDAVTGWVNVTDAQVDEEYRRRNEKVKLDLAVFHATDFEKGITPTDAEITAEYESHQDAYRVPEKRRVRYVSISTTALRDRVSVTPQEVEARYRENIAMFTTPEQIRASHILFKTEGKDKAAVRKTAEDVLARAKAGEDFAALAKRYSEDTSASAGGDLGFHSRGDMVAEFDQVAWALQPGQVSDIVESPYGFHIIKLLEKREASTRSIDEVRPQLEEQIKQEKAQTEAARIAQAMEADIDSPDDLSTAATRQGLTVGDSGLFARDEPLAGLGYAPAVAAEAFNLDKGKVSDRIATSQGYAFIAVDEIVPSAIPPLDQVRDKVQATVVSNKAIALAREKAQQVSGASGSFTAAARAAGATVRTTELIARGSSIPEIGVSPKVDEAAFALTQGQTSQPIATDTAVVVVHVAERQDVDAQAMAEARDALRAELLQQRANTFFAAYMAKATQDMKVTYNQATVDAVIAGR